MLIYITSVITGTMYQKNQEITKIEKIENVIYNSLTGQQYHENTCFKFERLAENKTKLLLNITKYGIVPINVRRKMIIDVTSVKSLGDFKITSEHKNEFVFEC